MIYRHPRDRKTLLGKGVAIAGIEPETPAKPPDASRSGLDTAFQCIVRFGILLTSDAYLRGMDFQSLTLLLQGFDVAAPVIATPREIVRKFHR